MHHFIISLFGDCLVLHYLECNVFLKYIVGGSGNVDNSKNKIGKYNCWKKTIQFWYIFKAFRVLMITCFLKHFFFVHPTFFLACSFPPSRFRLLTFDDLAFSSNFDQHVGFFSSSIFLDFGLDCLSANHSDFPTTSFPFCFWNRKQSVASSQL